MFGVVHLTGGFGFQTKTAVSFVSSALAKRAFSYPADKRVNEKKKTTTKKHGKFSWWVKRIAKSFFNVKTKFIVEPEKLGDVCRKKTEAEGQLTGQ